MKRLYVGGLSHTISEKDLRDRFGKFGEVSDVEIITRKDENGSPLKTFCYINISVSDSEYKRCLTVLNKSKWKGGTLQIELAKESFLHRLAEERQKAAEKIHTPRTDPQEKIVESFKTAGVENFHMKAAVPGTEIPGHKDWVVSKFGRVLPVLHLKCQGTNKVTKYDPSKHCHNIKKLNTEDSVTPVSKLTWEVDGGYDEISKKRRGEFPPQKKCLKKIKKDLGLNAVPCGITKVYEKRTSVQSIEDHLSAKGKPKPPLRKPVRFLDSDPDSEEEIRMLVAQECSQNQKTSEKGEHDNLEVVGDDFVVKSNMFWGGGAENGLGAQLSLQSKDNEEYDSADTDEILTQNKGSSCMTGKLSESKEDGKNVTAKSSSGKVKKKSRDAPETESEDSDNSVESSVESVDSDYEAMMGNCYRLDLSLADLESLAKNAEKPSENEESDDTESELEAGPSKPAKLLSTSKASPTRAPSKKTGNNPEDILAFLFGPDVDKEEKNKTTLKSSLPAFVGTKDLFGPTAGPSGSCLKRPAEKIDSGSLGEDHKRHKDTFESKKEPKGLEEDRKTELKENVLDSRNKNKPSEPSHQDLSPSIESIHNRVQGLLNNSSSNCSSSDEMENNKDVHVQEYRSETVTIHKRTDFVTRCQKGTSNHEENITLQSSTSNAKAKPVADKALRAVIASTSSSSTSEGSDTSDEDEEKNNKAEATLNGSSARKPTIDSAASHPKPLQKSFSDAVKQQQDNQKRLAALEQRQKEAELQKKLIQGALSKVDNTNANKGKHIVFDSDDEVNDDAETSTLQTKSLFEEGSESSEEEVGSGTVEKQSLQAKECKKAGGSKLFDSSEDEDDDTEEDRFQIKPQFEGKAGQKLMELQSRFGTDSRFQMDAKFLENDDEAEEKDAGSQEPEELELAEEKKKNLAILQSLLNVRIQPSDTSKESVKAKTFRDISALHYDPTSEAHVAFETKTDTPVKESKATRRKKREEAEKLPEVSKEIYFDVAVDLKEVFGTSKTTQDEKELITWDKEDEENEDKATAEETHTFSLSSFAETEKDASSCFKFSFFGNDLATEATPNTDVYKIETLKGAKVSWQVDPRFQDSSSDEDDVEDEEENKDQSASITLTSEEPAPTKKFFFFLKGTYD